MYLILNNQIYKLKWSCNHKRRGFLTIKEPIPGYSNFIVFSLCESLNVFVLLLPDSGPDPGVGGSVEVGSGYPNEKKRRTRNTNIKDVWLNKLNDTNTYYFLSTGPGIRLSIIYFSETRFGLKDSGSQTKVYSKSSGRTREEGTGLIVPMYVIFVSMYQWGGPDSLVRIPFSQNPVHLWDFMFKTTQKEITTLVNEIDQQN